MVEVANVEKASRAADGTGPLRRSRARYRSRSTRAAALAPQWNPEWFSTGFTTRLRSLNGSRGSASMVSSGGCSSNGPRCSCVRLGWRRAAHRVRASRAAAVSSPSCAGAGGFSTRSADEPVVGLHHRVGEEHLPLDGADRENREAAAVRELAEPVSEVALPLPAQPRDPMRKDSVEEAFRDIKALEGVVCGRGRNTKGVAS